MISVEGQGQFCKSFKQTKYKPGQGNCRSRGEGRRRVKEAMLSHWAQRPAQERQAAMWWGGVLLRKSKEAQMWGLGKTYLE